MKNIFIKILMLSYAFSSLFILMYAIVFPFCYGIKGNPDWIVWFLYPITIVICASQRECIAYFESKDVKLF